MKYTCIDKQTENLFNIKATYIFSNELAFILQTFRMIPIKTNLRKEYIFILFDKFGVISSNHSFIAFCVFYIVYVIEKYSL